MGSVTQGLSTNTAWFLGISMIRFCVLMSAMVLMLLIIYHFTLPRAFTHSLPELPIIPKLLRFGLGKENATFLLGDLQERWERDRRRLGEVRAAREYRFRLLISLPAAVATLPRRIARHLRQNYYRKVKGIWWD